MKKKEKCKKHKWRCYGSNVIGFCKCEFCDATCNISDVFDYYLVKLQEKEGSFDEKGKRAEEEGA